MGEIKTFHYPLSFCSAFQFPDKYPRGVVYLVTITSSALVSHPVICILCNDNQTWCQASFSSLECSHLSSLQNGSEPSLPFQHSHHAEAVMFQPAHTMLLSTPQQYPTERVVRKMCYCP